MESVLILNGSSGYLIVGVDPASKQVDVKASYLASRKVGLCIGMETE
jgi:hypothetical protein